MARNIESRPRRIVDNLEFHELRNSDAESVPTSRRPMAEPRAKLELEFRQWEEMGLEQSAMVRHAMRTVEGGFTLELF